VAEAAIFTQAVKLGINVLRPQFEHGRYDLAFEIGSQLLRVQCKWAPRVGGVVVVNLTSSRRTSDGSEIRTTYSADEIDAVAAYCQELDACYWLPIELVAGKRGFNLRVAPTQNGQQASINWAADYELSGAVAQLEVAPEWHSGGRRFESGQLHSPPDGPEAIVGAHEFRNRFGRFMERAAAGETFHVTRRGKPYVRLSPALE
jgi:prevent-host-death family protein